MPAIDISNKQPFRCEHVLDNKQMCNCQFFKKLYEIFYVSPLESGQPLANTAERVIYVCINCGMAYTGAKPAPKQQ